MMTSKEFLQEWPVPDQERMGEIRDHVHEVAGRSMNTPDEYKLMDLYRGYSEVVRLFVTQFGWDPTKIEDHQA